MVTPSFFGNSYNVILTEPHVVGLHNGIFIYGFCILLGYLKNARDLTKDYAEDPLFAWVDEDKVFAKPTYKRKLSPLLSIVYMCT